MKITNVASTAREIAVSGQVVQAGKTVEVDKELGEALLRQPDVWTLAGKAKAVEAEEEV